MAARLVVFRVILVAAFALIFVRLSQLQVVEGARNRQLAEENRIRVVRRLAPRGTIYDREGRLLATSRLAFSVCVVPQDLQSDGLSQPVEELAALLAVPPEELLSRLAAAEEMSREPVVVWRDVGSDVVARVEEHSVYLDGLSIVADAVRQYPNGSLAAHLLGYVRETSGEELSAPENVDYRPGDLIGKSGIERIAEAALRGIDGGDQIEVDARGRRVRTLGTVPATPGQDVWLTLDLELQRAAAEALGSRAGAVVALDPWTGEVLAMESHPAYDPNIFASALSSAEWRQLSGPERPQRNRATTSRYEPGSLFKLVTAAAALEAGVCNTRSSFRCDGAFSLGDWRLRCWKREGHGSIDFLHGFAQSCNVMFVSLGRGVGPERLAEMARRFGLGEATGFDLPPEAEGLVPSPRWKRRARGESWYPGDTCQMAVGQGDCLVTPLQMARAFSVVANGGRLVRPHVIRRTEGRGAPQTGLEGTEVGLRPETIAALRTAMEAVVAPGGTAQSIATAKYAMAGKTGTAQNPQGEPHAWFAGYAPAERPKLVVAVVVENAGQGSVVAAPVARHVFDAALLPPAERAAWPASHPSHEVLVDAQE